MLFIVIDIETLAKNVEAIKARAEITDKHRQR